MGRHVGKNGEILFVRNIFRKESGAGSPTDLAPKSLAPEGPATAGAFSTVPSGLSPRSRGFFFPAGEAVGRGRLALLGGYVAPFLGGAELSPTPRPERAFRGR